MGGHAGKKSSPWPQSLQRAAVNVYVRAGKSRQLMELAENGMKDRRWM